MPTSLADRLRARCEQLSLHAGQVAELAEVNRSFVYDIMRGRSEHPNLERLDRVAQVLKVERRWLLHGLGEVEGDPPILEDPDQAFVAIPSVAVSASMGGGSVVDEEQGGKPYHFQRSWIRYKLRAKPADLRIMHVEDDSMLPTLHHGDIVLVDLARRAPTPPASLCCTTAWAWSPSGSTTSPNSEPPRVRIISDNALYAPYDCTGEEVNIIGQIRWFAREI